MSAHVMSLAGGKYTLVRHECGGMVALRYGEPWRHLTGDNLVLALAQRIDELEERPIPMILHCPSCHVQHIDKADDDTSAHPDGRESHWDNPPHRSHLCHNCGTIWRPADVATVGVEKIQTEGKRDVVMPPPILASGQHSCKIGHTEWTGECPYCAARLPEKTLVRARVPDGYTALLSDGKRYWSDRPGAYGDWSPYYLGAPVPNGMALVPERFIETVRAAGRDGTHPRAVPVLIAEALDLLVAAPEADA